MIVVVWEDRGRRPAPGSAAKDNKVGLNDADHAIAEMEAQIDFGRRH